MCEPDIISTINTKCKRTFLRIVLLQNTLLSFFQTEVGLNFNISLVERINDAQIVKIFVQILNCHFYHHKKSIDRPAVYYLFHDTPVLHFLRILMWIIYCLIAAPGINWSRSVSSHSGSASKPTGIADVYSKFRPVKRVSPLKHQPDVSDAEAEKSSGQNAETRKDDSSTASVAACDVQVLKCKSIANGALFGELEHYDLDMDEILDVPYIKSNQQTATLPRLASEKRPSGTSAPDGYFGLKAPSLAHAEPLGGGTQYCVLPSVNWPDMRKSKSMDPDYFRTQLMGYDHPPNSLHRSTSDADKLLSNRPFPDTPSHKGGADAAVSQSLLPVQSGSLSRVNKYRSGPKVFGDGDEENKKSPNIINIVREGQISLLVRIPFQML